MSGGGGRGPYERSRPAADAPTTQSAAVGGRLVGWPPGVSRSPLIVCRRARREWLCAYGRTLKNVSERANDPTLRARRRCACGNARKEKDGKRPQPGKPVQGDPPTRRPKILTTHSRRVPVTAEVAVVHGPADEP